MVRFSGCCRWATEGRLEGMDFQHSPLLYYKLRKYLGMSYKGGIGCCVLYTAFCCLGEMPFCDIVGLHHKDIFGSHIVWLEIVLKLSLEKQRKEVDKVGCN